MLLYDQSVSDDVTLVSMRADANQSSGSVAGTELEAATTAADGHRPTRGRR